MKKTRNKYFDLFLCLRIKSEIWRLNKKKVKIRNPDIYNDPKAKYDFLKISLQLYKVEEGKSNEILKICQSVCVFHVFKAQTTNWRKLPPDKKVPDSTTYVSTSYKKFKILLSLNRLIENLLRHLVNYVISAWKFWLENSQLLIF